MMSHDFPESDWKVFREAREVELVRRNAPWRDLEAVEPATLEWSGCLNNRRPLEPIGYISQPSSKRCAMPATKHRP